MLSKVEILSNDVAATIKFCGEVVKEIENPSEDLDTEIVRFLDEFLFH